MEYKVLTIWQPWASLLIYGSKKIETKPKLTTWTAEKGTYLIHAASKWSKEQERICLQEPFISELEKIGFAFYNKINLPLGKIIGSIEITECKRMCIGKPLINEILKLDNTFNILRMGEKEKVFGNYEIGRYAWLTQNPRILKTPISYKGGQGYYIPFKGDENQLEFL